MIEIKRKNSLTLALFTSVFKVSLGLISYPLFLKFLNSFDLSMYLLFISTIGFVELLDLNFSPNLVRYFSYADAGLKTLSINNNDKQVDLLSDLFVMARQYYRFLCAIACIIFGFGFSVYLYYFTALHHKNFIYYELNWLGYMVAILLGIYFTYLSPALIGRGHIDRVNRVLLISKLTAVIIQSALVYFIGLPAIILGALISTIIERILLLNLVKNHLNFDKNKKIDRNQFYLLLKQFWSTNYKLALIGISITIIARFKAFTAGFVIFDANLLAQFLFSLQVFAIAFSLAIVPVSNNYSDMSAYFISDKSRLQKLFFKQNRISLFIILFVSIVIIFFGNILVQLINVKHPFLPWTYLIVISLT
ncbi:MAG: polysaccharide biosynthesis protein [Burkholderiales bacterium]|nr:polysaccharide biosynthesis protein [Burkholderiales bacterium]